MLDFIVEVYIVLLTIGCLVLNLVPELTFSRLRILIVKHIQCLVPACTNERVLFLAPVTQTGDLLLLCASLNAALCSDLSCVFVIVRFTETLSHHPILCVETVSSTTSITDEQFTHSVVQAHASDIGWRKVLVDRHKAAIRSVPCFDTPGMSRNERIEDGVVEDLKARILVCEVVVYRLVVVIENE